MYVAWLQHWRSASAHFWLSLYFYCLPECNKSEFVLLTVCRLLNMTNFSQLSLSQVHHCIILKIFKILSRDDLTLYTALQHAGQQTTWRCLKQPYYWNCLGMAPMHIPGTKAALSLQPAVTSGHHPAGPAMPSLGAASCSALEGCEWGIFNGATKRESIFFMKRC